MKFVAFSDSHASRQKHEDIVETAKKTEASCLVCAGDFTMMSSFAKESLEILAKAGLPLLLVPGNHECVDRWLIPMRQSPFVHIIDRTWTSEAGVTFFGRGAADWSGLFDKPESDAEIRHKLSRQFILRPRPWIFVTHVPPSESEVAITKGFNGGSAMIRSYITEFGPELVICGHVHNPQQTEDRIGNSWVVNVACTFAVFAVDNGKVERLKMPP
jgi:Icc-related predicted phosphoesterase